jgi:hypothetical protein
MNDNKNSSSSSSSVNINTTSLIRRTPRPVQKTDHFYNTKYCEGNIKDNSTGCGLSKSSVINKEENFFPVPSNKNIATTANTASISEITHIVATAPLIHKGKAATTTTTEELDWTQWKSNQDNQCNAAGGGLLNAFILSAKRNELCSEEDMSALNFKRKKGVITSVKEGCIEKLTEDINLTNDAIRNFKETMDKDDMICEEIEEYLIIAQHKCGENQRTMDCLKTHANNLNSFRVKVAKAEKETAKIQQAPSTSSNRPFELRDLRGQDDDQETDKDKLRPRRGRPSSKERGGLHSVAEGDDGAEEIITAEDRDSIAPEVGTKENSSEEVILADNLVSNVSLQMSATSTGVKRGYDEVQQCYDDNSMRGDNSMVSLIPQRNSSYSSFSGFENIYDTLSFQAQGEDCDAEEHVNAQDKESEEEFYI